MNWAKPILLLFALFFFRTENTGIKAQTDENFLIAADSAIGHNWWYKLRIKSDISPLFGSFGGLSVSFQIGYEVNRKLFLAAGPVYMPSWGTNPTFSHNFGARVMSTYHIWKGIQGAAEYEWLYYANRQYSQLDNHLLALGGGYRYRFSNRFSIGIWCFYDFLRNPQKSPYPNPLYFRIAVTL
jgi:hypothetical protein